MFILQAILINTALSLTPINILNAQRKYKKPFSSDNWINFIYNVANVNVKKCKENAVPQMIKTLVGNRKQKKKKKKSSIKFYKRSQ